MILEFPDFEAAEKDPNRPLLIQTDASGAGVSAILSQKDQEGRVRPIYFASRTLADAEKRYSTTELEALALKFAVEKFASYIIGFKVRVETDHSALVQMFKNPKECKNSRVDKWAMSINSRFNLEIVHKPGASNANADALSRSFPENFDNSYTSSKDSALICFTIRTKVSEVDDQKKFPNRHEIMAGMDRKAFIKELETSEFSDVYQVLANKKWPLDTEMCI